MQVKVFVWLVAGVLTALCGVLWGFTSRLEPLWYGMLEGRPLPALTALLFNAKSWLWALPAPWVIIGLLTSLRRRPGWGLAMTGAVLATAVGALLAFFGTIGLALPPCAWWDGLQG